MTPCDRLTRIEENARDIIALLRMTRLQPDPDTAASIHDRALLIHRETTHLCAERMDTRGNA